jgi:hypothetical protein
LEWLAVIADVIENAVKNHLHPAFVSLFYKCKGFTVGGSPSGFVKVVKILIINRLDVFSRLAAKEWVDMEKICAVVFMKARRILQRREIQRVDAKVGEVVEF